MMPFNNGDVVIDREGWTGIVIDADDIHNIKVRYDMNRGIGLYCADETCSEYDGLKIAEDEK